MNYEIYEISTPQKRVAAAVINTAVGGFILSLKIDTLPVKNPTYLLCFIVFSIFTLFPESPGNRIMNMKVLDLKKGRIDLKRRAIRNSPYLVFLAIGSFFPYLGLDIKEGKNAFLLVPTHFLLPIFLLANAVTLFVNPIKLSLIDMFTKSQVYSYPKIRTLKVK